MIKLQGFTDPTDMITNNGRDPLTLNNFLLCVEDWDLREDLQGYFWDWIAF